MQTMGRANCPQAISFIYPVIPAQAEIQLWNANMSTMIEFQAESWTPAFAGVTARKEFAALESSLP